MPTKPEILAAIRRNRPAPVGLPSITGDWTAYPDRAKQFTDVLELIGGQALRGTRAQLDEHVRRLGVYTQARHIASLVPGIGESNVDLPSTVDPHALENIDVAILSGELAVAENAAVWVTDRDLPPRVLFFICQHLVLVVPSASIVDHMHAAYENLSGAFTKPAFGAFISGPSKTADIEQTLVIGAHGPRSLTVCLLDE